MRFIGVEGTKHARLAVKRWSFESNGVMGENEEGNVELRDEEDVSR